MNGTRIEQWRLGVCFAIGFSIIGLCLAFFFSDHLVSCTSAQLAYASTQYASPSFIAPNCNGAIGGYGGEGSSMLLSYSLPAPFYYAAMLAGAVFGGIFGFEVGKIPQEPFD